MSINKRETVRVHIIDREHEHAGEIDLRKEILFVACWNRYLWSFSSGMVQRTYVPEIGCGAPIPVLSRGREREFLFICLKLIFIF